MKSYKIFSIAAIAALLLAPTTLMAKTNFSISLNLFDYLAPRIAPMPIVVPPPPPPGYYFVPCPPPVPYYAPRTVVKEYHYYHHNPQQSLEEIHPSAPYYNHSR